MQTMVVGPLQVELHRKAIKNLHLSVMPPDGRVRVAAPAQMSDTAIRLAIIAKLAWIKRKQTAFIQQARQSPRQYESGECHYLWGRRLRLQVVPQPGKAAVRVVGQRLLMQIPESADDAAKQRLLAQFYRNSLKQEIQRLALLWPERLGLDAAAIQFVIRVMKTKWGSCNPVSKRVLINLELAKKPPACLEYIVVHELVHLLERHHNERFLSLLDGYLPDWRERRALLNEQPLAA